MTSSFKYLVARMLQLLHQIRLISVRGQSKSKRKKRLLVSLLGVIALYLSGRYVYKKLHHKYMHYAPGPIGLPVVGSWVNLMYNPQNHTKIARKYGALSCHYFFGIPVVMLNRSDLVKQVFTRRQFQDRYPFFDEGLKYPSTVCVGDAKTYPLIFTNGEQWLQRRKHAQASLFRSMTSKYVTRILREAIANELNPFLENVIANENGLFYPREIGEYVATNTIFYAMFGCSIKRESQLYADLITVIHQIFELGFQDTLVRRITILQNFKSLTEPLQNCRRNRNRILSELIQNRRQHQKKQQLLLLQQKQKQQQKQTVLNNEKTKTESASSHKVLETYIDYTNKLVDEKKITSNEQIADCSLMFFAGVDTTSSTLDFGMVLIAKHVGVQNRVRQELLSVMGNVGQCETMPMSEQMLVFANKRVNKCPLFRALVYEILRISSVVIRSVNRCNIDHNEWISVANKDDGDGDGNGDGTEDVYQIKRRSILSAHIDHIHNHCDMKDEHWKHINGDTIYLENFLDDTQTRFVVNESFVGFGVGRRACLGRTLAIKELNMVFGHLLLNFELRLNERIDNILNRRCFNPLTAYIDPPVFVKIQKRQH